MLETVQPSRAADIVRRFPVPPRGERRSASVIGVRKPEGRRDVAILSAMQTMAGCDLVLPVWWEDRWIGHAVGMGGRGYFRPQDDASKWFVDNPFYRCAITDLDGHINAAGAGKTVRRFFGKNNSSTLVANNFYDLWGVGGNPDSGAYGGTARTAKQCNESTLGSMWHGGNVSTDTKQAITIMGFATANLPTLLLYDRVIAYDQCNYAAAANQTMDNTLTAQRYAGSGDPGLELFITAEAVNGATAGTFTALNYTNDQGNSASTVPSHNSWIVSAAARSTTLGARLIAPSRSGATFVSSPNYPIAAGDKGIRKVDNYTPSANNTGTMCWVLGKLLAVCPINSTTVPTWMDLIVQTGGPPIVKDGACLSFLVNVVTTSATSMWGFINVDWG